MASVLSKITRGSFEEIYLQGRGAHSPLLGVKVLFPYPKAGTVINTVVVSSKVAKLAVNRNQLKRRIKAILREFTLNFTSQSGAIIVLTKKEASRATTSELRQALLQTLSQTGILSR